MDLASTGRGSGSFKVILRESLRYWEKRRPAYNLVLAGVVLAWLVLTWPHFLPALRWDSLARLLVLALIANIPYFAVYAVDIPLQRSSIQRLWIRRRWILWVVGMLFAILITCYWIADEIYPYVN